MVVESKRKHWWLFNSSSKFFTGGSVESQKIGEPTAGRGRAGGPRIGAGDWMPALEEEGRGRGCAHLEERSFSDPLILSRCCFEAGCEVLTTGPWISSQVRSFVCELF